MLSIAAGTLQTKTACRNRAQKKLVHVVVENIDFPFHTCVIVDNIVATHSLIDNNKQATAALALASIATVASASTLTGAIAIDSDSD